VDVKHGAVVSKAEARISDTFLSKKLWKSAALISSLPRGRRGILVKGHSLNHHLYADDMFASLAYRPVVTRATTCIHDALQQMDLFLYDS